MLYWDKYIACESSPNTYVAAPVVGKGMSWINLNGTPKNSKLDTSVEPSAASPVVVAALSSANVTSEHVVKSILSRSTTLIEHKRMRLIFFNWLIYGKRYTIAHV